MDYQKIGLKCGIEIHQQLEGKKLFCSCPTTLREDAAHFVVERKIRASAGESGEVDVAAQQEQFKDRIFSYEGYYDSTCLVELDEEPPHEINQEALYTVLQFCKIVGVEVSPIVQVMRKTIVDGSATSAFQRTALVARGGSIETPEGKVRIDNINLEEDAAKIIQDTFERKTYRVDRLGIPLIEIGTAPDIHTPQQAYETAKQIGMLLRSLPGVKRGLGTIRQDVNVSIKGGARIEIKGVQDLRQISLFVELEVKRQLELLKLREELKKLKLNAFMILDVSTIFQQSSSKVIVSTLKQRGMVGALKLAGLQGYLKRELQPQYHVGTELSGRAKAFAGVAGIFHSDELPAYGITAEEVQAIRKELKCGEKDAFVVVSDTAMKVERALLAVYERAAQIWDGIPKEVRKVHDDGTTSFLRLMPGAARMYPETDVALIRPDTRAVRLPELLGAKIERYQKMGLSKDLAEQVAKSDKVILFEELTQQYPAMKPAFVAEVLTSMLLEIKRQYQQDPEKLTADHFRQVFVYLSENKIHKDILLDVLIEMCKGTFQISRYEMLGTEEIHRVLQQIVQKNPNAPFAALMGMAMKQLARKASGKIISDHLKKLLEHLH